ncbi:agglutinin-like protein isoform X2 [Tasmannia lanceolata]|uniref:agglutinin-like protein isoform X2 n=1 Tax=Tasmannia lanceolata TaxID=3420 RepID=UPI0040648999
MFNWEEDEFVDIIWGENGDSGDHIVPYPNDSEENTPFVFRDFSKKHRNQQSAVVAKPSEQKTSCAKNDFPSCKQKIDSHFDENEEPPTPKLDVDLWPDVHVSTESVKGYADRNGWDSMGTEMSNVFAKGTNLDSVKDDMLSDRELFGNVHEDKGSGSFLDYSWDSIGNFDDFDRIIRNDDSILGHEMIGNADEMWSSSTEMINSQTQSFPMAPNSPCSRFRLLGTSPVKHEVKMEFPPYNDQPLIKDCEKINDIDSCAVQNVLPGGDEVSEKGCYSFVNQVDESSGEKIKLKLDKTEDCTDTTSETITSDLQFSNENSRVLKNLKGKVNRQRKLLKCQKKLEETSKTNSSKNTCGSSSPKTNKSQQFMNVNTHASASSAPQSFPSSVLSLQRELGRPESLRYLHSSSPCVQTGYQYPSHHFSAMPTHIHSDWGQSQFVIDSYKCSTDMVKYGTPVQKSPDIPSRQQTMTPQEKIEKLRRRQQMQAMLAIQHQQQQFGHQVTCTDHSITQKFPQENPDQDAIAIKTELEENSVKVPILGLNSPVEPDDSSKTSMLVDEHSLEETTFDQLQSAIGKLDSNIRLCIRDSLFRLAESATQRHGISDTSSTNKSSRDENEVNANEETYIHCSVWDIGASLMEVRAWPGESYNFLLMKKCL